MHRRFPTAILFIAALLSASAFAEQEPVRASIFSVSLSGGFSYRDTLYQAGGDQAQTTLIQGTSPTLLRLRADWLPLGWLGVEGEATGDFFQAIRGTQRVGNSSQRGLVRLGAVLRFQTAGGFLLNGSLGYGAWWSPVVRISSVGAPPVAASLPSNGPIGRVGIGYAGERFEGIASAMAQFAIGQQVNGFEPQLWLAGRVADLSPVLALWVGLDAGLLLENSPDTVRHSGRTLRFALAVKLQFLPPPPPPKLLDGPPAANETALQVEVLLPGGAPAAGALVTIDSAGAVPVDAQGQLVVRSIAGKRTVVSAKLSGYRPANGEVVTPEGKRTLLSLQLEALTGPGQLSGIVRASATGNAVPDATVTVGEGPGVQTGADGTYKLANVGPGPVKVRVEAQGFTPADEVAQVPPESEAKLDVQLEPLGKGSPATVRGLIRSATGAALKASVVIKGLATKVQVTAEGRFFITVPGGTYLFVISAPGHVTQTKKVVLADGDQAIVHAELQKVSR
jgi:hypothetical protein